MGRKAVTDQWMGSATFRLELDLRLYFVHPMTETGNGIDPAEGWQRKSPRDRSREFNAFFRALVRFMVESMNNESVAFAMHTTKRYFSPSELETTQTTPAQRFQQAEEEFDKLTEEEKRAWEERVCRTYPRLDRVFALRQSWKARQ